MVMFPNLLQRLAFVSAVAATLLFQPAQAQIAADNTLGTRVNASLTAPCTGFCRITNGTTRGSNLFHSFRQFSLPNGDVAGFFTTPAIQTIIVRVTGQGNDFISNINGTIATSSRVNFFLLNPNGIVFGPGATLSIGGAFLATTAERIQFQDGTLLSTRDPTPLLTISVPIGLQLGPTSGMIQVNGSRFLAGQTDFFSDIALVGGEVTLEDTIIRAPGRRVEFAGIADSEAIGLYVDRNNLSLRVSDEIAYTDVALTDSLVNVAGANAGSITIYAHNLSLAQESILLAGITASTATSTSQAGDIILQGSGQISLQDGSAIANQVYPRRTGNSGNIIVSARSLLATNNSQLDTSNFGQGNAGNIIIQTLDQVALDNSSALSRIIGVGKSGNIQVSTGSLSLTNGAQLSASTLGIGNAGDVAIQANWVAFDGASSATGPSSGALSTVQLGAIGNAGQIRITTDTLALTRGAQLNVSTRGQGNAGSIRVNTRDTALFDGIGSNARSSGILSEVGEAAIGNGGEIQVNAGTLVIANGAKIDTSTGGQGNAGNTIINTRNATILDGGSSDRTAGVFSQVRDGAIGNGGDLTLTTQSLVVKNGALLSSTTFGQGDGGDITIRARDTVTFDGVGKTGRSSAAGSQVGPGGSGNGGHLRIETGSLLVTNGAQLSSGSFGDGNAGEILIQAQKRVLLDGIGRNGANSGIFSNLERGSLGQGGRIRLKTGQLLIRNQAAIASNSFSIGRAGDIDITADSIYLDTQGRITSATTFGDGGNINIKAEDLLILRHNSQISTTSSFDTADLLFLLLLFAINKSPITVFSGNGGNINIQADFVISAPNENSDITANAFSGNGGNVTINTQGIYWLMPRSRTDLARLLGNPPLNPQRLPSNDITAISQENPTLNGQITLNIPDADPSRGLQQLPVNLIDPSNQITQRCTPGSVARRNSFIMTGRGGLPENPVEPLQNREGMPHWIDLPISTSTDASDKPAGSRSSIAVLPDSIVEANNWIMDKDGNVRLVASHPRTEPWNFWRSNPACFSAVE